jgi:RimJ/RimL family protein N-acetyltransferase
MSGLEHAQEEPLIVLETARLRLRRFVHADIERLVELDSDPEVMRYISFGEPTPREVYEREFMPRFLAMCETSPLTGYWAAETRDDGVFVGWAHLRPDRIDPGPQELCYRLRRAAWGRGHATELGRALVDYGFLRVAAGTITARALSANARSWRVMEKCGLRYASDFLWPVSVLPGRTEAERAGVKYSVTRRQWSAQRA